MKGRDKFQRKLAAMSGAEITRMAGHVLQVGADMIASEAHNSISRGSVERGGHVRSMPGDPPNRETGDLQSGIRAEPTGPLEYTVISDWRTASWLEFGTSTMAARPYMRPARDKMAPKIQALFAAELDKLIGRN